MAADKPGFRYGLPQIVRYLTFLGGKQPLLAIELRYEALGLAPIVGATALRADGIAPDERIGAPQEIAHLGAALGGQLTAEPMHAQSHALGSDGAEHSGDLAGTAVMFAYRAGPGPPSIGEPIAVLPQVIHMLLRQHHRHQGKLGWIGS